MRRYIAFAVIPTVVDVDEKGEFTSAPYQPFNAETGQVIACNVPISQWKGWDWRQACDEVFAQLAPATSPPEQFNGNRAEHWRAKKPKPLTMKKGS